MTNDDARLWEISENLHRSELTKLERDENIAEWIKITDRILSQSAKEINRGRGQPEGGVNAAARELGVDRERSAASATTTRSAAFLGSSPAIWFRLSVIWITGIVTACGYRCSGGSLERHR